LLAPNGTAARTVKPWTSVLISPTLPLHLIRAQQLRCKSDSSARWPRRRPWTETVSLRPCRKNPHIPPIVTDQINIQEIFQLLESRAPTLARPSAEGAAGVCGLAEPRSGEPNAGAMPPPESPDSRDGKKRKESGESSTPKRSKRAGA
jgi:hypothetical protein